jgi:hypothetical protein
VTIEDRLAAIERRLDALERRLGPVRAEFRPTYPAWWQGVKVVLDCGCAPNMSCGNSACPRVMRGVD